MSTIKRTKIRHKKPIITKQALCLTVIVLLATSGPIATADDIMPHIHDVLDVDDWPSPEGRYPAGTDVLFIVGVDNEHFEEDFRFTVYGQNAEIVGFMDCPANGDYERECNFKLDPEAASGTYTVVEVDQSTNVDQFTVIPTEIPEFPTVALPLIASVLLVWGFMKKKKGL